MYDLRRGAAALGLKISKNTLKYLFGQSRSWFALALALALALSLALFNCIHFCSILFISNAVWLVVGQTKQWPNRMEDHTCDLAWFSVGQTRDRLDQMDDRTHHSKSFKNHSTNIPRLPCMAMTLAISTFSVRLTSHTRCKNSTKVTEDHWSTY